MTCSARWRAHKRDARKGRGWLLQAAMRKHGFDNFLMEEVVTVETRAEAAALEISYIQRERSRAPEGYNLTEGGDGARGYRHTAEWKRELSLRMKGRKLSVSEIEAMRLRMKGVVPSEEARQKMSRTRTGRKHLPATIARISESTRLRWATNPPAIDDDWKARMKTLRAGKHNRPEHNERIRQALTGRKVSEESRERMRIAARLRESKKKALKSSVESDPEKA